MRRFVLIVALVGMAASGRAQETLPLQLVLKPGDVMPLKVVTRQQIEQSILAQRRQIEQEVEFRYSVAVDAVDAEGIATATVTWDGAAIHRTMGGEIVGDEPMAPAVNADAAARAKLFEALKGQRFKIRVTPAGEVLGASETEAAVVRLAETLEPANDEERALMKESLREQYGDVAMREAMERVLAIYPEKPVKVGESWTRSVATTKGFPLIVKSTYTLKEATADSVVIEEKGEVTSDSKPIANPPSAGSNSYTLMGGQTGTIALARDTGWYKSAKFSQQAYGRVAYDAGEGMRKTVVPLSIKTETTIAGREETQ
jgi:hypothetical protein